MESRWKKIMEQMGKTPSRYQSDILEWVETGSGNAIVDAVPGSGKTTTLEWCSYVIQTDRALFCAFNRHIRDEIKRRLPVYFNVKTMHQIGFSMILGAGIKVNGDLEDTENKQKYRRLVSGELDRLRPINRVGQTDQSHRTQRINELTKLVNQVRLRLLDYNDADLLEDLYFENDCEFLHLSTVIDVIPRVIRQGITMAEQFGRIDYTDQLCLPEYMNLPARAKYQWVMVDEAQDLNKAQQKIVGKSLATGGRILMVGDPRQSIYLFAGASPRSFFEMGERFNAKALPLSICYRCPKKVIERLQMYNPVIEGRPDAPEGEVLTIDDSHLVEFLTEGHFVICRNNAPLIGLAIKLIRHQKPARIKGRDIGEDLVRTLIKVGDGIPYKNIPGALEEYKELQLDQMDQREVSEEYKDIFRDKIACLQIAYAEFGATDLDTLIQKLEALFDDKRASIWLSTIHKAKGLEFPTVVFLYREDLPKRWATQSQDELDQENNLILVGESRATDTLVLVKHREIAF